jgi:sugar phosphate isomerase/epimerase
MYTIRDFTRTPADLAESIEKLAKIGYTAVQLSAVGAMNGPNPAVSADDARKLLDDHGIKCIATHRGWDALLNNIEAEIEFHRILDCDFLAIGGVPASYRESGELGFASFAHDAQPVIERLKSEGIRFGYHNHDFEFERVGPERNTLLDTIADTCGPDLMMELDVYWAQHAGANPSVLLRKWAGRVPVIHLKDKEVVAGQGPVMAAIGEGNLDWDDILAACRDGGVEWYAVEQDICRRDPFDCLRSSFEFLTKRGL